MISTKEITFRAETVGQSWLKQNNFGVLIAESPINLIHLQVVMIAQMVG